MCAGDHDETTDEERVCCVLDVALRRRSVRDGFSTRGLAPEVLEQIVDAGLAAPSSKDARPWRFHVVTSRQLLHQIAALMEQAQGAAPYVPVSPVTGRPVDGLVPTVGESAAVLRQVPCAIVVENTAPFSCGPAAMAAADSSTREQALVGYGLEMMGIGGAVQSMWLTAVALGLAGVFMGDVMVAGDQVRALLGMDGALVGLLALGEVGEASPRRSRHDPGRVVHHCGGEVPGVSS